MLAAIQEERLSRIKNDSAFPARAIRYCLDSQGMSPSDLDAIVFFEKPFLKFERIIESYFQTAPFGFNSFRQSIPLWIGKKMFFKNLLRKELKSVGVEALAKNQLLFSDHHLSHAACSFYPSGFEESAIVVVDAVGEWATSSIHHGKGKVIKELKVQHYPDSVGLLYSAFTQFLGFEVNSGEYKLMGLAPYGNRSNPNYCKYIKLINEHLVKIFADGSIKLNQKYFSYMTSLRMIPAKKWEGLFGLKKRTPNSPLSNDHSDLALAIQATVEDIILALARHAKALTGCSNICVGGGVALNSVANGKLLTSGHFKKVYIPFAPGDAGAAIGCALAFAYTKQDSPQRFIAGQNSSPYLGPAFSDEEIEQSLEGLDVTYRIAADDELFKFTAEQLYTGKIVGWFQGRAEFGARALGNRSILANPCLPEMQARLNHVIKNREGFRPFAPAILEEHMEETIGQPMHCPYMQYVLPIKHQLQIEPPKGYLSWTINQKLEFPKSIYPAVTHVDFSARLQTVRKIDNPRFHSLIESFHDLTNCPMLLNTSFNRNNEPIVNSPSDALECFSSTEMDILVMNNFIVTKNNQYV